MTSMLLLMMSLTMTILLLMMMMLLRTPAVDCHLMNDAEEEDGNDEVLVNEEEKQWQHLINYSVSLPVVATAVAGCHERRHEVGLLKLHEQK